jgi:hypothetical protein
MSTSTGCSHSLTSATPPPNSEIRQQNNATPRPTSTKSPAAMILLQALDRAAVEGDRTGNGTDRQQAAGDRDVDVDTQHVSGLPIPGQ